MADVDLLPRTVANISWLAGLLEGEGCFTSRGGRPTPIIQLCMTDKDVVIRAARILGANKVTCCNKKTAGGKDLFRLTVFGRRAVAWVMTLYPLMGLRRQEKIRETLAKWKASPNATYTRKKCTSRGARVEWLSASFVNVSA